MGIPYAEVIGDPIAHSKSPLIHKFWLEKLGIDGDYRATRVKADELTTYLESRRADPDWRGCNVAMPLKGAAWRLVDHVDPSTRRLRSLNAIVRHEDHLAGANTDWVGLNLALDTERLRPERAAIIGTGGAARAAMEEMRQAKVRLVSVVSRSIDIATRLLADFVLHGEVVEPGAAPTADLLINASPLGMAGYPPQSVGLGNLSSGATVLDMVYVPADTELLRMARDRGLRTVDGLTMLTDQAAMAFTYFFKDSPEPADSPEARKLLVS